MWHQVRVGTGRQGGQRGRGTILGGAHSDGVQPGNGREVLTGMQTAPPSVNKLWQLPGFLFNWPRVGRRPCSSKKPKGFLEF